MNQTDPSLTNVTTGDIKATSGSAHPSGLDRLVTLTLDPFAYPDSHKAEAEIRRQFPQAKEIIEKVKFSSDEEPVEIRRFVCTYPTMADARDACRQLER